MFTCVYCVCLLRVCVCCVCVCVCVCVLRVRIYVCVACVCVGSRMKEKLFKNQLAFLVRQPGILRGGYRGSTGSPYAGLHPWPQSLTFVCERELIMDPVLDVCVRE